MRKSYISCLRNLHLASAALPRSPEIASRMLLWSILSLFGTFLLSTCLYSTVAWAWPGGKGFLDRVEPEQKTVDVQELPQEAQETLQAIQAGGPFPFDRDGITFGNYEGRLPRKKKGYYREYTVLTPGVRSRGARRIITGENGEYYYTADHYRTFERVALVGQLTEDSEQKAHLPSRKKAFREENSQKDNLQYQGYRGRTE